MKFLFLSSYAHLVLDTKTDRVSGGAELQVALLARELVKRGHEVVIVGGDSGQSDSVVDGVRLRNGGKFQTGAVVDALGALPRVFRIIRDEEPHYVVVLGWTTWLTMLTFFREALRYHVIFICGLDTEVNGEFRRENPVRGMVFERGVRAANLRMAMTEHQADLFVEGGMHCGMYRNLILPRRAPLTAEKTIDLLWVARCQPIKRPHLFLDLAEELPDARCEMVCVREDVTLWEEVAERAGGMANVDFIERVPYHEAQDHYDAARIFVNTSTYEGWPNSFIQAGLGGAALASLDVNSDDLFGRFGLGVYGRGDFDTWAKGIAELLGDEERLGFCQRECGRFVEELHDNDRNVDLFLGSLSVA
ncbi:MAG: glycosyltransferase family 4 protein [Chthoniobacterales bacterium]